MPKKKRRVAGFILYLGNWEAGSDERLMRLDVCLVTAFPSVP